MFFFFTNLKRIGFSEGSPNLIVFGRPPAKYNAFSAVRALIHFRAKITFSKLSASKSNQYRKQASFINTECKWKSKMESVPIHHY